MRLPLVVSPNPEGSVELPSGTEAAQFLGLIYYRFNESHTDILQHIKMRDNAEGHPETGTGQFGKCLEGTQVPHDTSDTWRLPTWEIKTLLMA